MGKYSNIGVGIALRTGKGVISAGCGTLKTIWRLGDALVHKDSDKAVNVAKDKIKAVGKGIKGICREGCVLAKSSYKNHSEGRDIIDENTSQSIIRLGAVIGTVVVAGEVLPHILPGDDTHGIVEAAGIFPDINIDDLDGVHNGMLVDNSDLDDIISAGELEDSHHLTGAEYARSAGAKEIFLHQYDYESIPEGYEIHHIVPLCQGGADSPENMVLLSESDHAEVTAAHSRFYGWHSNV